ncbi:MAG TPA: hypothetical protein VD862_04135 [Candidatus Paceibacterota bacterium]|nr:hypothetical protein [Candidatus Paceibacterota bacterium]
MPELAGIVFFGFGLICLLCVPSDLRYGNYRAAALSGVVGIILWYCAAIAFGILPAPPLL